MKNCIEQYIKLIKEALKDLKTPGSRIKQIPNILTSLRLLSPFVIIPMVATGNLLAAGISTLLFSATDLFDGFIARKLNITSELGKDLDAVTDKMFVGTLMASLILNNIMYIIPFVLEATIASINICRKIHNKNPESNMMGKVKITSLYFLLATGFINMYFPISNILIGILYGSTMGLQMLTIREYCIEDIRDSEKINLDIKEEITKENKLVEEKNITQLRMEKYKYYKEWLQQQKRLEQLNIVKEESKTKKLKK